MEALFLNYSWPVLWHLVSSEKNEEALWWKAALLAAWWQSGEQAKNMLPPIKNIFLSKNPLLIFVFGLIALSIGDVTYLSKAIRKLENIAAPLWMKSWLKIEEAGRKRMFKAQANLINILPPTQRISNWPYVACLQSLDQASIDPLPLLNIINIESEDLPKILHVLYARLMVSLGKDKDAMEYLKKNINNGDDSTGAAIYHLALAAFSANELDVALESWDRAAQLGFIDLPNLERWITLSISHPIAWIDTPARVSRALELSARSNMREPRRLAASFLTYQLIYDWCKGDLQDAYDIYSKYHDFQRMTECRPGEHSSDRNSQVFFRYLLRLFSYMQDNKAMYNEKNLPSKLHAIGESHSLSVARACIKWKGKLSCVETHFVMGVNMWSLANSEENYYKKIMKIKFSRLSKGDHILMCVGEIDCRPNGGIWRYAGKNININLNEIIQETVDGYLNWLNEALNAIEPGSVTIQGIPAPNYNLVGNHDPGDRNEFTAMIRQINIYLKKKALEMDWSFLDVYSATVNEMGLSNKKWHIDGYHLIPGFYLNSEFWIDLPGNPHEKLY